MLFQLCRKKQFVLLPLITIMPIPSQSLKILESYHCPINLIFNLQIMQKCKQGVLPTVLLSIKGLIIQFVEVTNSKFLLETKIFLTHQIPKFFFFNLLMKVLTDVHCGVKLGNPKFPGDSFICYQDMEILNFLVYYILQFYFPTNGFIG